MICNKCKKDKDLSCFAFRKKRNNYNTICRECRNASNRKHYDSVKAKISREKWRSENRDKYLESCHKTYYKLRDKKIQEMREYYANNRISQIARVREYQDFHPEYKKKNNIAKITRRKQDTKLKLHHYVSVLMRLELKGGKQGVALKNLVSWTIEDLKEHLEKKFTKKMSWENYGSYWHIDHIIPVRVFHFKTPTDIDFQRCWALANLRPLESKKNCSKGGKLKKPFQPSLSIGGLTQ